MTEVLKQRVIPKQNRSKKMIDLILNTSLDILEEVGFDSFTTKLVSERAKIRVRNIYRYFPNKLAIIAVLAERIIKIEEMILGDFSEIANPAIEWENAVRITMFSFAEKTINEKSILTIRHALHGSPELLELDRKTNLVLAEKMVNAIKRRGVQLPEETLTLVSEIIIDTTTVILNNAAYDYYLSGDKEKASRKIEELILLITSYCSHYL